jgi:hypothetical protein
VFRVQEWAEVHRLFHRQKRSKVGLGALIRRGSARLCGSAFVVSRFPPAEPGKAMSEEAEGEDRRLKAIYLISIRDLSSGPAILGRRVGLRPKERGSARLPT